MSPTIHASPYPDLVFPDTSLFTHLLGLGSDGSVGGYPGSHSAFIDAQTGVTLTRARLRHLALAFGYGITHHPKLTSLQRGDTTLIFAPNSLAWPVVQLGLVAAGLRVSTANSAYTPDELAFQFKDCRAKVVVTVPSLLPTVLEMYHSCGVGAMKRLIVIEEGVEWVNNLRAPKRGGEVIRFEEMLEQGVLEWEEAFDGNLAHETVYMFYSSGTTGRPKGVETTHRNVVSMIESFTVSYPPTHLQSSKILAIMPFFHMYGGVMLTNFPLRRGLPIVIMSKFDLVEFCTHVQRHKVTDVMLAPPVILMLAKHPVISQYDLSSLRTIISGAAPLAETLIHEVTQRLLNDRQQRGPLELVQGMGLTETSTVTHMVPTGQTLRKPGSVGVLSPGIRARIIKDDGLDAEVDEPGEMWINAPTVMKGYLNNPTATAETITPDGWLKTGDIVTKDKDHYWYVVDRKKELIKYKGFQVAPAELESVLLTHPNVADVAVIGIDSPEKATELPRAYIVCSDPNQLKDKGAFAHEISEWIKTKVARHKYLRGGVVIVDEIPKSPSGKLLRKTLREQAKQERLKAKL